MQTTALRKESQAFPHPSATIAQTSDDKPSRQYVLECAARLIQSDDYLLARNLYSYLLKHNLRDESALSGLGLCFYKLGDSSSSQRCFRAVWELYRRPDSIYWLGLCAIKQQNDVAALEAFSKISDPMRLEASLRFDFLKEYGNCQTRVGAFDSAEKNYREALKLRPHSDAIFVNLGTLELQREGIERAEKYFQDALTLNPNNSRAHCGLGFVLMMKHQSEKAENRFLVALDLDSQNLAALLELVAIAHQKNSFDQLKPRLTRFLLREPGNMAVRYQLAVCLYREGQWLACEREIDLILQSDKHHEGSIKLKLSLLKQKPKGV